MQSYLQHRRFAKRVERQFERDQAKAESKTGIGSLAPRLNDAGIRDGEEPSTSNESCPSVTSSPNAAFDAEKGERDNGHNASASSKLDIPSLSRPPVGRERSGAEDELTHIASRYSQGTALGHTLTGVSVRRRSTRNQNDQEEEIFVVGYEGPSDPLKPHNWSFLTRAGATINIALVGFIVGFASSVDSAALDQAAEQFHVSKVVESLATGLFLIGFGVGGLAAGPISETLGRNPVYITTLLLYMIFVMASALAPNIGSQLAFRFLAGIFASSPLTCAGGSVSDLWTPIERTYAFPVFANAAFAGPILGPVIGGFIGASSRVSWQWTEWITLIISGAILAIVTLFQAETYTPILLKWKAQKLRELTGDSRYKAEMEIREIGFVKRLLHALYRPFVMTIREPIIILIALYLTVIYIILFTFLNGYTFIFTETFGLSQGLTGLAFIGIGIGLCLATCLVPLIYIWAQKALRDAKSRGEDSIRPEFRLWFAMLGAPAIPISLFWMGWTAYPSLPVWSPLAASILFGYGILCVFITSYQYIIDAYEQYAASALASITLIRYIAAGGSVAYSIPFYTNVGVHWTLTILGAIALLLTPVPYLFFWYGHKVRSWSRYAVT